MAEKRKSNKLFFIILIIALVIVNGLILMGTFKENRENKTLREEKELSDSLRIDFQSKWETLSREMEELMDVNAAQDARISEMMTELEEKKAEIIKLLSSNNLANKERKELKAKLAEAEGMIASLLQEKDAFMATITKLQEENLVLSDNLAVAVTEVENLTIENASLVQQKDSLYKLGSILKADNVTAKTYKIKNNNKLRDTRKAKKVDKLDICFDIHPGNKVSPSGDKMMMLKIIGPGGAILSSKIQGSGTFDNLETGKNDQFTRMFKVTYDKGESKNYCVEWAEVEGFDKGIYGVEVYQLGYLIGTGGFELK